MFIENKPDELELLSFFECEPIILEKDNGSYLYVVTDQKGCRLDFSFSVIEGWIQYAVSLNNSKVVQSYIEGVSYFSIKNDKSGEYLYTEVITTEQIKKIEIRVKPYILINSGALVR